MQAGEWYSCLDPELESLRMVARRAVHEHRVLDPDRTPLQRDVRRLTPAWPGAFRPGLGGQCRIGLELVGIRFLLAEGPGIEVLSCSREISLVVHVLTGFAPKLRSREVRRILARRDRFQASWRRGQCSAPPA
ncbi:maltose acetyltransferase domain-containing protein [Pseudooceanicola nanhaiensis]